MTPSDGVFLAATIELAEQGRLTCAPNPPVGCIIVRDGQILGRGCHVRTGEGHAEVNAMADAGGDIAGATVYVSLEPCAFVGRTPACAQTLIEAAVARVVIAATDPHPRVAGAGIRLLRAAGIEVNLLTQPAALELIQGYVCRELSGKPFVRIKTASSLDGATALASGESQWITGPAARQDVQYWRARSDAIITGVQTVLDDNPQLNVRAPEYQQARAPLRVVLDSRLNTPATAHVVTDGGATLLVHNSSVEVPQHLHNAASVTLLALPDGPADLHSVLAHLAGLGCNEVLVEAGAKVCGSFVAAELWDEWLCYVAPKWLGVASAPLADFTVAQLDQAPRGIVMDIQQFGDDLRVRVKADRGE
ncbi:MAG: bifunctional diaminohydroxyphosphoribosylaminopyrimidine deaminase/5-amino-6-(5-phosphoribosylamino)uracil reductase RibD [bacterium]